MSFYLIKTIAGNEMRTLLRSWFFRIFASLAIIGLGIFNIAVNVSSAPWIYRALACSIPYANLIILNLGQAIVAVFLASEFLKQDSKNDTIEVIYARSMTNGEYILGKTLGILLVFFTLNLIVLSMGIGFSFLNNDTTVNIAAFLIYPLLISLPTLVFILGLAFFLMVLLKNQAVTFIILLGYIALTLFYLESKAYHLFDYIAYNVPMTYSPLGGYGNLLEILLHRSIYLIAGIGFIFFTIYKLQRLPQSKHFAALPLVLALVFIGISGLLILKYYKLKDGNRIFKQKVINLNNLYADYPKVKVASCYINLEHLDNKISVKATLNVKNQQQKNIDTLLFSLNPSLKLNSVSIEGKSTDFKRELHLIIIPYKNGLKPNDSLQITFVYIGKINENVCFIDRMEEGYSDNFNIEVFNIRKRFAFINDNYVCLTSEALWYPTAGAGYATVKPFCYFPDFTKFSLKVKTTAGLVAVSQGKASQPEKNVFDFKPEYALPKISLLIGNYNKYQVVVDSVEYSLFTLKGNEYFKSYFNEINDTIKGIIRDLKHSYEFRTNLEYPFKRFALVEAPIHFSLDNHLWSFSSDAVQPEMILYPEKGLYFKSIDFNRYAKEQKSKKGKEAQSPRDAQIIRFRDFVYNNIITYNNGWRYYLVDYSTYSMFSEYYSFISQMEVEKFPAMNMAVQAYLNEKVTGTADNNDRWYRDDLTNDEKVIIELKKASLETLIKRSNSGDPKIDFVRDILAAKGTNLFNLFGAKFGKQKVDSLLKQLIINNRNSYFSYDEFLKTFQLYFKESPENYIQNWYSNKTLPGIIVKDINSYKVVDGYFTKFQVIFKVSNPEPADAIINVSTTIRNTKRSSEGYYYDDNRSGISRTVYLPANSAREIGLKSDEEPAELTISTSISENLPNSLTFNFPGFNTIKNTPAFDSVIDCPVFTSVAEKDDIIVDNEDNGFSFNQTQKLPFLKSLLRKKESSKYDYKQYRWWNPPQNWDVILNSGGYGKYVHSLIYTKAGTGDQKVCWKTPIKEKGFYDVSFYYKRIDSDWRSRGIKNKEYNFLIYHDGGVEKAKINIDELDEGWNLLGSFYISADTAKVEQTNKSVGNTIFADAIKWSKSK